MDALKAFVIKQGASRRVITMEWDKFWADNKAVLEYKAPRYMGVNTPNHPRPSGISRNHFYSVSPFPMEPEKGSQLHNASSHLHRPGGRSSVQDR